jgi:hypothetical protein
MPYSKNERAKNLLGLRPEGIPLDSPSELGYQCPERNHHIEWSEYNGMIWCKVCNVDIPSCLCMPDLKNATEIFLDIIDEIKSKL